MESSRNMEEWNNNCDMVKAKNAGYPPFWYGAIIVSGLAGETMKKFSEVY